MADYDDPRPSSQPVGSTDLAVAKDNLITFDRLLVAPAGTAVSNRKGEQLTPWIDLAGPGYQIVGDFADVTKVEITKNNQVYTSKSVAGLEDALWRTNQVLPYTPTGSDPTQAPEEGKWTAVAVGELTAIARSLNVSDSQVIYSTDTVTVLGGVLYIHDPSNQTTWGKPSGVGAGEVIDSVTDDQLQTDIALYAMLVAVPEYIDERNYVAKRSITDLIANVNLRIGQEYFIDARPLRYKVVAAATGIADGGAYIDLTGISGQLEVQVDNSVDLSQYEAVADYHKTLFTGTDNTTAILNCLTYAKGNGLKVTYHGLFKYETPIVLTGGAVVIEASDVVESALYCSDETGDALTLISCNGFNLERFVLLGAYSTSQPVTNKGLVLRQCARCGSNKANVSNFAVNIHQDGGFLHTHNNIQMANWRVSPLKYTYNDYADSGVGVAHNQYINPVFSHELDASAIGADIQIGEITFEHPRGEDYGQEFFNITWNGRTVQNVYIYRPVTRSDAAGVRGRCLRILAGTGEAINNVVVTNPDFISDAGYDVISIDGPLVQGIDIPNGKVEGGEHGLRMQNGCANITYTPDSSKNHQKNAIRNDSTGTLNYIRPAKVYSSNLGLTLTGDDRAHILITGQNCHIGSGITFFDAFDTILYGVSRPAGTSSTVTCGTLYDHKGDLENITKNINYPDINSFNDATSAANLGAIAGEVNTKNKFAGKRRYNATDNLPYWATGSSASSTWKTADGLTTITPS